MEPAQTTQREERPRVLVAYGYFAIAAAVADRLRELADVELAPPARAARRLAGDSRYEAVVLCPYLSDDERQRLIAACEADGDAPAIIALADLGRGAQASVRERRERGCDVGASTRRGARARRLADALG
jgi:hypothetical protein